MNMVDDATDITMSLMAKEETTEAAMRILWAWIKRFGIPAAISSDRKNVYITEREPTMAEQLGQT
jgi:DNA gyrase inhibitor GyrI